MQKKILPIGRGGAILTDDLDAYEWIKIASFDGRHPGVALADDKIDMVGWNCYMTPKMAARGHLLLSMTKDFNEYQEENPPYPDLSKLGIY